jgi:phosphotransferase system HPr (HPr) family protein
VNAAEAIVDVTNSLGIHVRTAAILAGTAIHFLSAITITFGNETVDARSAIDLVALGVERGAQVKISARGRDAADAIAALKKLFDNKFGED